jgi:hypothetical protein
VPFLEKNIDKLNGECWINLSSNVNAISLLQKCPEKINERCLYDLSSNPNGILLLEKYKKKMDDNCWNRLSRNPGIFTYDYDAMCERCLTFKEQLIQNRFHPRNIGKFRDWRIDGFDSDSDSNSDGNGN